MKKPNYYYFFLYFKDENFFGIGIETGNLKIVWSIDGTINQYVLISNITVNNGVWHTLLFKFNDTEILSSIDNEDIYLSNQTLKYFLNSDGLFYLGNYTSKNSCKSVM